MILCAGKRDNPPSTCVAEALAAVVAAVLALPCIEAIERRSWVTENGMKLRIAPRPGTTCSHPNAVRFGATCGDPDRHRYPMNVRCFRA